MKMHARKTGWLIERTERILFICDVKKRRIRSSNVFPAAPILSPPEDSFPSYGRLIILVIICSPVSPRFRCGRVGSRERENGVSRTLPKTGRGDITEGDHQSCASPGTWICLFFCHSFLFPLFLFLDKIQEEMDKSCLLFGVCGERKGIPVSDSCGLI